MEKAKVLCHIPQTCLSVVWEFPSNCSRALRSPKFIETASLVALEAHLAALGRAQQEFAPTLETVAALDEPPRAHEVGFC